MTDSTKKRIDFRTFILSLSASAQVSLGSIPNPETKKSQINLSLAKQTIDILEMLEEKTKGNLTEEEGQFLTSILHQLHMQYVEVSQKGKSQ